MRKLGTVCITVGTILLLAALSLVVYNRVRSEQAEQASAAVLAQMQAIMEENNLMTIPEVERNYGYGNNDGEVDPTMDTITIDGDEYIGTLEIPRFGLALPIMAEWSYTGLQTAPGLYYGSVWTNDMVICAHNYDRHFGNLKNLEYGDEIIFTDVNGVVFEYEVLEVVTLQPTAVEEMKTGDWWDMTLFTCTIGGATRVTVRCSLVEE